LTELNNLLLFRIANMIGSQAKASSNSSINTDDKKQSDEGTALFVASYAAR
jgi:hypothetical protein